MKKNYLIALITVIMLASVILVLNVSVSTKQGVNYQVHEIRLPLYLKALDFVDRHYNYKNLLVRIIGNTKDDNAKTIKILNWVASNVRRNPKELPVIDDHPLNILIRGYGMQDQFEDIFTILCAYAGREAFFETFKNSSGKIYCVSFVKIDGRWCPVSAFDNVYATKGNFIASMDDILLDQNLLAPFMSNLNNFEKDTFLKKINSMDFNIWSIRVKGQSPIGRAACLIKKAFHCNLK